MENLAVLKQKKKLLEGDKHTVATQDVWLLQVEENQPILMELEWDGGVSSIEITGDSLLLLDRVEARILRGELNTYPIRMEILSKLLAFMDEARGVDTFVTDIGHWASMQVPDITVWHDRKRCEFWFLLQMSEPSEAFSRLITLLRHSESYLLVRFLLSASLNNNKLQELGQIYGLSYSHFRRLCHHALGGGAKAKLRDWRMARSLLDVLDGRDNLTQVAMKHGYASPAHFSHEIKRMLGVSPSGLLQIIQLATK